MTRSCCAPLMVLVATIGLVAAQNLSATNVAPLGFPIGSQQLQMSPPSAAPLGVGRIKLANLTSAAVTKLTTTQGNEIVIQDGIAFIAPNTSYSPNDFSGNNVAIIPCDPAPGFLQPVQAVQDAITRSSPAIILYSATQDYCNLTFGGGIPSTYMIYTTTNTTAWQFISQGNARSGSFGGSYTSQWYIGQSAVLDNVTTADRQQNGLPFGGSAGSPSTAVAMIILYSITGVITALFLVIIVTGAIRAHRHPERYGPRNVMGRPRQSRAKGLARAMLETLPIVKFGEKEEDHPKPVDLELAHHQTAETTESGQAATEPEAQKVAADQPHSDATTAGASKPAEASDTTDKEAPVVAPTTGTNASEDAPGCSICTEDFERGQDVRILPCQHSFHPACIDPWLLNVSGTCPLCRIDLRPESERENETSGRVITEGPLPPPLDPEGGQASGLTVPQNHRASRRLSGFITDILNPSRMQSASREERIAALRRLREHGAQHSTEEGETRRRRRLTARLGETFGVRTRARGSSPPASGPAESSTLTPQTTHATAGAARSIADESIPEEPTRQSSERRMT